MRLLNKSAVVLGDILRNCACASLLLAGLVPRLAAATGTIADVQHVVIFMQENRSFDHYFGSLRGVRGFNDPNTLLFPGGGTDLFQPQGVGYVLPFHLTTQCVNDVAHDWTSGHTAWNSGKWNQWVPAKGTTAMTFYTRAELAFYYALADAYTVCDAYHCSVLGPTNPNRLYLWTGMIDPRGTGGGPAIDNSEPGYAWKTYPERLQAARVSWRVYQQIDNYDDNALAWFNQYRNAQPGNPLYDRGMTYVSDLASAMRADVTNGTLPRVSWVIAATSLSEHPPYSPASGEVLTAQLLAALASNPDVFNSTVFLLTYDENGGFFDHVPPPTPPAGTPDEFVSGLPIGLGVRVPMVVISPWSRGGYLCSQVFDHTSIIRFLETWTGVAEPNISAWRRKVCGDLTTAFNFTSPENGLPTLPGVTAVSCPGGNTPAVPSPQSVPVPESGSRPMRALPYQLNVTSGADCAASRFYLLMTNQGVASAHLAVYANAFRTDGPWQFDVGPGALVSNAFNLATSAGRYDLTCYGPNGFQRRYAGSLSNACNQFEASSQFDLNTGTLNLAMRNSSSNPATFTASANAYLAGGPWVYQVPPGSTSTASFEVAFASDGWYDLTLTTSGDPAFLRRLAGRIEPESRLSVVASPSGLHLAWPGSPSLKVQSNSGLDAPFWEDVPGTLGTASANVPAPGTNVFFRLSR